VRLTPPFPLVVAASPAYFARRGRPGRPEDLRNHACLRQRRSSGAVAPWLFVEGNRAIEAAVSGPLLAHDYLTLVGCAVRGLGLVQAPRPLAEAALRDGRLEPVLEAFAPMAPGVFLYHPGKRQILPKLRAFIDHVKGSAGRSPS